MNKFELIDDRPKSRQAVRPLNIKQLDTDGTFEGYGSVFGVVDSYGDEIQPGAFTESLAAHKSNDSMPKLLWQHRSDEPIGVYDEMREDKHGLFVKGTLAVQKSVPTADKAYSLLKMGAVNGLSIGFNVPIGGEEYDEETRTWKINTIDLWETSIVTFPANRDAQITEVRDAWRAEFLKDVRDFEAFLRDAGLSKREAKRLIAGGWQAMRSDAADADDPGQCDADQVDDDDETIAHTSGLIEQIRGIRNG